MKRLLILLAAVLLLSSCSTRYDYQNGVALHLREIKGDKYSAEIWVEMVFEDGSLPTKIEADQLGVERIFPEHKVSQWLIPLRDGPKNVGLLKYEYNDDKSINNKDYTFVAENIYTEDKIYSGRWELPITIKNGETSVKYTAVPKAEDKNKITFMEIEVCPYTLRYEVVQPASMFNNEETTAPGVLFGNGEKRKGSGGSRHSEIDGDKLNSTVTIRFGSEVDINTVTGLVIDGVEYTLTKV